MSITDRRQYSGYDIAITHNLDWSGTASVRWKAPDKVRWESVDVPGQVILAMRLFGWNAALEAAVIALTDLEK